MVLSDFKLATDHRLIKDLIQLRKQISETLKLPLQTDPVVVYLFRDEVEYYQYLHTAHPGLPARRAYFIGTAQELAVYTYWGDGERIQEDLRHEYTHGLLHACLDNVPLWLDEGLAEYFEVAGPTPGGVNPAYVTRLADSIRNGWKPDMERLERLEKVEQMQRADYCESWAWMHFLLHSTPDTKQCPARAPPPTIAPQLSALEALSKRLEREIPELNSRFISYMASVNTFRHGTGSG